jgi:hypothetical protein
VLCGCVVASFLAAGANAASGPNLVVNGSFDAGTTGFTTSYTIAPSLGPPATLAVGNDPHLLNGGWASYHDHTTGHGPMLVVNGSTTAGGVVWSEQIAVSPDTTYTFSGWEMSLYQPSAVLRLVASGLVLGEVTTPVASDVWTQFGYSWSSGSATTVTLQILDESSSFGGNDFALDDLSFVRVGGAGGGAGGNPRLSTIASSIASPANALSSGKRTLENLALAAALALFITFPAQLFNHTFDENYAEIREWWKRRFAWLERLRRLIAGGESERTAAAAGAAEAAPAGRNTLRDTIAAGLVVLVGGLLGGLLDPHFGLTRASVLTFASVVIATVVGITVAATASFEYRRRRRLGTAFRLHALPAGLLIAAACVLVSRLSGFEPGYLYGLVCGVAFAATLGQREEGQAVVVSVLATLAAALVAWSLLVPLGRLASHRHEAWPVVIGADFAGALFTAGIVGSLIGAFPLDFLPGGKVIAWHRGAWAALFALAAFLFLELILNPGRGGHRGHAPLVTVLVLFAVFGAGSVWFYLHFERKKKAKEPSEQEGDTARPAPAAMPPPDPSGRLPT